MCVLRYSVCARTNNMWRSEGKSHVLVFSGQHAGPKGWVHVVRLESWIHHESSNLLSHLASPTWNSEFCSLSRLRYTASSCLDVPAVAASFRSQSTMLSQEKMSESTPCCWSLSPQRLSSLNIHLWHFQLQQVCQDGPPSYVICIFLFWLWFFHTQAQWGDGSESHTQGRGGAKIRRKDTVVTGPEAATAQAKSQRMEDRTGDSGRTVKQECQPPPQRPRLDSAIGWGGHGALIFEPCLCAFEEGKDGTGRQ